MFEFQKAVSEGDALKARIASKSTDSPTEQPENEDVVNVSEDAPEKVEAEAPIIAEAEAEPEESGNNEQPVTNSEDEGEDLYVEYKGREINLKDIEEWEQGNLRQSDYTRKTQGHAKDVETFNAEKAKFESEKLSFNSKLATLDAMIQEDTPSAETLKEWREYEPEKLLDYQDKQSKRKELLNSSKEFKPASTVDVQAEQTKLWQANPSWADNGQQTQAFTDDMNMLQGYAAKNGYSNEEIAGIQSAHHWQTMLSAAKYEALQNKNSALEKKVRKAPVSTRPKAQTKTHITTEIAALDKQVRKYGRESDFVKLRQLKRQLNK